MSILDQQIIARDVLKIINERLERINKYYFNADAEKQEKMIAATAEAKWHLATLKLQFIDLLTDEFMKKQEEKGK